MKILKELLKSHFNIELHWVGTQEGRASGWELTMRCGVTAHIKSRLRQSSLFPAFQKSITFYRPPDRGRREEGGRGRQSPQESLHLTRPSSRAKKLFLTSSESSPRDFKCTTGFYLTLHLAPLRQTYLKWPDAIFMPGPLRPPSSAQNASSHLI